MNIDITAATISSMRALSSIAPLLPEQSISTVVVIIEPPKESETASFLFEVPLGIHNPVVSNFVVAEMVPTVPAPLIIYVQQV